MSEIKLKRCPFCGGEMELVSWRERPWFEMYGLVCGDCHVLIQVNYEHVTQEELIEKFNTRKPMQEIVERIENVRDNVSNVDFKNGCNACLVEISRK